VIQNSTPAVRSFAAPENSKGMPFSERLSNRPKGFFDEVFDGVIKPAAEASGFDVSTASDTGGIFDVDNLLRVFEYNGNLWPSTIKTDVPRLEGHIRATWENRSSNRSYISILKSKA
jgi:hypothetical protein